MAPARVKAGDSDHGRFSKAIVRLQAFHFEMRERLRGGVHLWDDQVLMFDHCFGCPLCIFIGVTLVAGIRSTNSTEWSGRGILMLWSRRSSMPM